MTLFTLLSVESSCCSDESAVPWFVAYCVSAAPFMLSCTACAAPSGSSDAVSSRVPDEICWYIDASVACWSLIVWTFMLKYWELEMRIALSLS